MKATLEIKIPEYSEKTVATITKKHIVFVRVDHDSAEAPHKASDGMWTPYSFSKNHANFKHPGEWEEDELKPMLESGLAFFLSYYEHGNCLWMLKDGATPPGVEFQWDGIRVAGLLIWEHDEKSIGAKTREDRAKDAQAFLDVYNAWCNGETFSYSVKVYKLRKHKGHALDKASDYRLDEPVYEDVCGTYYGWDDLKSAIAEPIAAALKVIS